MAQSVYVIAGEVSGDIHAAELMEALRVKLPEVSFRGLGGPAMQKIAGDAVENWLDDSAVMGVWEVLKHYQYFKGKMDACVEDISADPPDLLLMVDYPGFNLRLAEKIKAQVPQVKIAQYVCPQVWAWNRKRIPKIARDLDLLICLFPFEPKYFEDYDLKAICVGHPVIDELSAVKAESSVVREKDLIGLFPGSREREIARIFPTMVETARRLSVDHPHLSYQVPAASEKLAGQMEEIIAKAHLPVEVTIEITAGGSHELMQKAACGVIASGTATLEAAYFGLPYCLVYKIAWSTFALAKLLVKIEHIGIVNILAGRGVVDEFIQSDADAMALKGALEAFVDSPESCEQLRLELKEVVDGLGGPGVHERIADELLPLFDDRELG